MPNGHDLSKEYGPHKYPDASHIIADCTHGCGCWMGIHSSSGPIGVDPSPSGECPANPADGNPVGGNADYKIVVARRIQKLESGLRSTKERAAKAEALVGPSKFSLSRSLKRALAREKGLKEQLLEIRRMTRLVPKKQTV